MSSMNPNRTRELKARLVAGDILNACWLTITDPASVELIADTGFDIVIIDSEHAPWDALSLQTALLAFRGSSTVPILRTRTQEDGLIKQAMDIGFDGLLVPNITSPAMAASVVASAKYPPMGTRGYGPRRASSYFRDTEYRDEANDRHIVLIQIEHRDAVEQAEQIMRTPGLDAVIIGPNDLSGSMNLLGQTKHPEVLAAIEKTIVAGRKTGTPVGWGVPAADEEIARLKGLGMQIIPVAADMGLLATALQGALAGFCRVVKDL